MENTVKLEGTVDTYQAKTIAPKDLTVKVNKGKATLQGTVDNWQEFEAAEQIVHFTNGVTDITNNLSIKV